MEHPWQSSAGDACITCIKAAAIRRTLVLLAMLAIAMSLGKAYDAVEVPIQPPLLLNVPRLRLPAQGSASVIMRPADVSVSNKCTLYARRQAKSLIVCAKQRRVHPPIDPSTGGAYTHIRIHIHSIHARTHIKYASQPCRRYVTRCRSS